MKQQRKYKRKKLTVSAVINSVAGASSLNGASSATSLEIMASA